MNMLMSKFKILIVEDDALVAKDIKQTLQNFGYSVTSIVTSGRQALVKVEKDTPDLVLMDIVLNGKMNGIETAHKIHNRFDIPVIYITAHSGEKTIEAAKLTEPYGYVVKPIDEKKLLITTEIALNKYSKTKKIDEALSESERRYRQLIETMNEGVVVLDENGIISYVNDKFLEMNGYTQDEVIGHSQVEFLEKESFEKYKKQVSGKKKRDHHTFELVWKGKDGQKVSTIVSQELIYGDKGDLKGGLYVLTDVTERHQVEKELIRSQWELRRLSQHLQDVREREGKRIALEIHDELGQVLTALKIDISYLSKKFLKNSKDKRQFIEKTRSMSELIDKTIKKVQKISAELRPGLLDDLGLIPAIEWYAQEFQDRTKIEYKDNLDCDGVDLDADCATAIFRIFQEALTNVARHSGASKVKVSLKKIDGQLELEISDNGKGILEKDVFSPNSLGFMGMRERIRPFGGELKLHSPENGGTILSVTIPNIRRA